ncbi:hypothetical protein [Catellatospora bangladeshensis]|uniref:Uncharacterized protein n=1 Tax=Catellatospora bangladeshensis TaxID=310355 RepID=A0A8J3JAM8_9ACTN|nr:hypothetical protein [Catellatospora bangladeshensis]GIF80691.1 hypothetical protein Cba03nite_20400 [Catellatospora bangladeshensis]
MTAVDPVFVRDGPLLDWFGGVFDTLTFTIPAGILGFGLPHRPMRPVHLSGHLLDPDTGFDERDRIWAGIVLASRDPATGAKFRLIAFGLALPGLMGWRAKVRPYDIVARADLDADLAYGFLRRLAVIDPAAANIASRLLDTATAYAGHRLSAHLSRPTPTESEHPPAPPPDLADAARQALQEAAAQMRADGNSLAALDVKLIAATRLNGHPLPEAARALGIAAPVAYKRRQRAEARLAAHLTGASATARPAAEAATATRPPAAIPAPRAPEPSPAPSAPSAN